MSTNNYLGAEKKQRDLLLVVDTSGSMGSVLNENSNMHQAVKAAFGILNYFESKNGQVALVEFADKIATEISWTNKYDEEFYNLITKYEDYTKEVLKIFDKIYHSPDVNKTIEKFKNK